MKFTSWQKANGECGSILAYETTDIAAWCARD